MHIKMELDNTCWNNTPEHNYKTGEQLCITHHSHSTMKMTYELENFGWSHATNITFTIIVFTENAGVVGAV